jgi:DNA-binding IclR family transcriptional regulator
MGLELLVDDKILRVLRQLLKANDYTYVHKVAREAKVPVATAFRILKRMVKLKIIENKKIGNLMLYKMMDNKVTKKIKGQL